MVRVYAGDLQGAIKAAKRCLELTPVGPDLFVPWCAMGFAYLFQGRYDEAIEAAEMSLKGRQRTTTALRIIVSALSLMGSVDAAQARARQLQQVDPSLRVSSFAGRTPLRQPEHLDIMSRGLRAAGIPE
jgi:tetratricopeptide (TPR) repeat protein